jgi:hypothetical protein
MLAGFGLKYAKHRKRVLAIPHDCTYFIGGWSSKKLFPSGSLKVATSLYEGDDEAGKKDQEIGLEELVSLFLLAGSARRD